MLALYLTLSLIHITRSQLGSNSKFFNKIRSHTPKPKNAALVKLCDSCGRFSSIS